ncbi:hypothetical protein LIER_42854 [Lithospermum erythrorhizon]|uniref:Coenzyme Q-binding protein COQ10 START domain-containing protein n=1 Tax=Lithospermum erythrorhizon TaxID=34254 RepID=A0AAV3P1U7_LITER
MKKNVCLGFNQSNCNALEFYDLNYIFDNIRYSPEQLFAVVSAVDMYEDFVPWCQRSTILRHFPDGSFDAELEIGFKFLVESYVSHVEMKKPNYLKIANMFFKEVVSRLVGSFDERCRLIYGPGVPLEKPYRQRA